MTLPDAKNKKKAMKSAGGPLIPTAVETVQLKSQTSFVKKAAALVLVSIISLGVVLRHATLPIHGINRCFHHLGPKAIEERVERILKETPLIGNCNHNALSLGVASYKYYM